ncbi:MAG: lamin tail domain-containing protein [Kofleriaceae bacterium]
MEVRDFFGPRAIYGGVVPGLARLTLLVAVAACTDNGAPQIDGLADQTATVGVELVVFIDGTDPEGDRLTYGVDADVMLQGHASLTLNPSGMGVFRWTPTADDLGSNIFDFSASDGDLTTTVSIAIEVSSATLVPIFRQPLGAGTQVPAATCADFDVVVDDLDSLSVEITEVAPTIAGATLTPIDDHSARWRWCPTSQQIAESDRYTLVLSADDGENPPTLKYYVLVLATGGGARLVINEVDYDQAASDTREFVELFNAGTSPIALAGLALALVNGATNEVYQTVDLSSAGTLAAGQYLVVAGPLVDVDGAALSVDPVWTQDEVQNGPTDGVALVDTVTMTLIDALSYEGAITSVMIEGFTSPISLVEGTALASTVADLNSGNASLCRAPNGSDTNNAAADWAVCATATPGRAN